MTPVLEAVRARCMWCQSQHERACLRVNGVTICLNKCLRPILTLLEKLDAEIWLEGQ